MKKIIYITLVLLGIVLITSNFRVDSTNIDHKKVSASGTACKWIPDQGYGMGPVSIGHKNLGYNLIAGLNENGVFGYGTAPSDPNDFVSGYVIDSESTGNNSYYLYYAHVLDCNESYSGTKLKSDKWYDDNRELLNGAFYDLSTTSNSPGYCPEHDSDCIAQVEAGYRPSKGDYEIIKRWEFIDGTASNKAIFNTLSTNYDVLLDFASSAKEPYLKPNEYTCVCAEY